MHYLQIHTGSGEPMPPANVEWRPSSLNVHFRQSILVLFDDSPMSVNGI